MRFAIVTTNLSGGYYDDSGAGSGSGYSRGGGGDYSSY